MRLTISSIEFEECLSQYYAGRSNLTESISLGVTLVDEDADPEHLLAAAGLRSVLAYLDVDIAVDSTDVWVLTTDLVHERQFSWVEYGMLTHDEVLAGFYVEVAGWGDVVPLKVYLVRMWVPERGAGAVQSWLEEHYEEVDRAMTVQEHASPGYADAKARELVARGARVNPIPNQVGSDS